MKKPINIDKLTVQDIEYVLGPYPSLGFVPITEADLGNGDYYGLYWPLGRENEEPIICDMLHDEWSLQLAFSSTDKFIEYLDLNEWFRGENEVSDEDFAPFYYMKARDFLSKNNIDEAINYLKLAIKSFPEDCEYWFSLSSQLRRTGNIEESVKSAVNAFVGNWVFSLPPQGVLRMLQNNTAKEILPNDPIIKRASNITMSFGGEKENNNYPLLKECIEEYFEQGESIKRLSLYQNYAYMMYSETKAFQERYNFNLKEWQNEYSRLCEEKLGDNRRYDS